MLLGMMDGADFICLLQEQNMLFCSVSDHGKEDLNSVLPHVLYGIIFSTVFGALT